MAVSYNGSRVTISSYKSGNTTSNSTTTLNITSGAIAAGDVGRLVAVKPSGTDSSQTQVRKITGVSGGTISIHDPWVGTISSGTTWIVAHTLQDIDDLGQAGLDKVGSYTYRWSGDWNVTGFLGDLGYSLEMISGAGTGWPIAAGGIVQFGIAWGGEGSALQTTEGCRLYFRGNTTTQSVYSSNNARDDNGGVTNYYNCLIHSSTSGSWMFQRMTGPTRFIGSNFDGVMGGRFYHEASEWAQCRMSGNDNGTPAWSIGATFTRSISEVFFYRNLVAMKNYTNFGGVLRNVTLENNGDVINRSSDAGSTFQFIDSTEFGVADIIGTGGVIHQDRSINIVTTDSAGSALSGVTFRVNNDNDATQGSVATSDGSGVLPESYARRFTFPHGSSTLQSFAPFRIRYRKYGFLWQELSAAVADAIKQSVAMLVDGNVTQSDATAQAHTGITVADTTPVLWNGKNYGITVTGDLSVNGALTLDDIKHYLHYHLAQTAGFGGKASGLHWHNLIPMNGTETQTGDYAGTVKGVRIIDEAGNVFPGISRLQADDGTYYIAPVSVSGAVTITQSGSRVQIYNVTTATELFNGIVSGTSTILSQGLATGTYWNDGDTIRIRATYQNGLSGTKKASTIVTVGSSEEWSTTIVQEICPVYATFGIDGSTVTEFSWDSANVQFDVNDPDNTWYVSRLFAWDKYWTFTEVGIREAFDYISAIDAGNIRIDNSAALDNLKTVTAMQGDQVRLFRPNGTLPVVNPTTGGGGFTFYSTGTVFIAETGVSGLTATESTQLSTIESAVSGTVPANIQEINGVPVTGSGTESDPWGP